MSQTGLNFNIPIMATKANGEKLNALSESIASSEATAGRNVTVFMTAAEATSNKIFSLSTTRVRYLDEVADPISTGQNSNFSIIGPGYTINKDASGLTGYCRDGTYTLDKNNKLVNNCGQYLQVYRTDQNGNPLPGLDPKDLNSLEVLDLSNVAVQAKPTSSITASGQLTSTTTDIPKQINSNLNIIDSLGQQNNLQLLWTQRPDLTPVSNQAVSVWSVGIRDPKGLCHSINKAYNDQGNIAGQDANGHNIEIPQGGQMIIEFDNTGKILGFYDGSAAATTLENTPKKLTIDWKNGAAQSEITLNLGTVGSSLGIIVGGDKTKINTDVNGYMSGDLAGFELTRDGYGIIHYTNNQNIKFCRIPLATFPATNLLVERNSGVFVPSFDSGTATLNFPGEGGTGNLEPGTREGSAVNVTAVYLQMIDSQSNYVGNLKTIETIKELTNRLMQI